MMKCSKKILLLVFLFYSGKSFCQVYQTDPAEYKKSLNGGDPNGIYTRTAQLAEQAAQKYDAIGCPASAEYCRKIKTWANCMLNSLTASNPCGSQPSFGDVPKCDAATIGGGNGSSNSSATNSDPIKEMQLKQQQMQQELNTAQNASTSAYENAINSGKKTSGALVDATLAGAQNLSDPKMSLAYAGTGLAVAGLVAISERKEAKMQARQEELSKVKASLSTSNSILNFVSGVTSYHITNLKVVKKSNGRIKNVIRTNLYDMSISIYNIRNTADSITIFESVNFKNIITLVDSTIINKIVFAIADMKGAAAYNGNYTNSYDYTTNAYANYRYQELDNSSIEHAFTMQGDFPQLPSGLTDVYIETGYGGITVFSKYVTGHSYNLSDDEFTDAIVHTTDTYLLVFDNAQNRLTDFVDYLNALK